MKKIPTQLQLLVLALSAMLVFACSGSSSSTQDNGDEESAAEQNEVIETQEESEAVENADGDETPAETDEPVEQTEDGAETTEDETEQSDDSEPACACAMQSECCDGCNAKNNGLGCATLEGKPDSGICQNGACQGFGACDHRVYGQAVGYACNFGGECAGGLCLSYGDEWTTYCSKPCDKSKADDCPEGSACVLGGGPGKYVCKPLSKGRLKPGDGTLDVFDPCNTNEDCAGGLCLQSEGIKFCSKECALSNGAPSDSLCGSCGRCRDNGDALNFPFKNYCVPKGSNAIGGVCAGAGDCQSRYCLGGYCTGQCWSFGTMSTCPQPLECVKGLIASDATIGICVAKEDQNRAFGETCKEDWSCAVGKCAEYEGVKRCLPNCGEEDACDEGVCVSYNYGKYCVPADWTKTQDMGSACKYAYQCKEGLECAFGMCLKGCAADTDCGENGICYIDMAMQAKYCSYPCSDNSGCPDQMVCENGACLIGGNGGRYMFSYCRDDKDCETGKCVNGSCTDVCSDTISCEGSDLIEPEENGMCIPCNPNNWDSECNAGDFGLNRCTQGLDGKYFCAINCGYQSGVCPVGTRCYQVNGYESMCMPLSGSCLRTTACSQEGVCVRPAENGVPCAENAECVSGLCSDGRCQKAACSTDADCGCAVLVCGEDGGCKVNDAIEKETEPNDAFADAQTLAPAKGRVSASLRAKNDKVDVDMFKAHLKAGQALDVMTEAFCKQAGDTYLRLLNADGSPKPDWKNDDIDPQGNYFSILMGYVAAAEEDVIIEVTQSSYVVGYAKFNYMLVYNIFDAASNDKCAGAIELSDGTGTYDIANGTNDYAVGSCTGYPAIGKDVTFGVKVPAGNYIYAELDAPFDGQIYMVADCAAADATCLAGSDVLMEPGVEAVVYANFSEGELSANLIVDSFLITDSTQFDLTTETNQITKPVNDAVDGAVEILSSGTQKGAIIGAMNDYNPGVENCLKKDLAGGDVVYSVTLEAGWFAEFRLTRAVGAVPVMYLVKDVNDLTVCAASGTTSMQIANGEEAAKYYLILDFEKPNAYGLYEFEARFGAAQGCFGPCDPAAYEITCDETINIKPGALCYCDSNTKTLKVYDCEAACVGNGATTGACHVFTTPGYERTACLCDYDCSAGFDHCEQQIYTNCSCASSDPCGWKDDGLCNEFCKIEYPGDYFDDPVDCGSGANK